MRKLLPLNEGDLVEVKEGFVKGRIGTVVNENLKDKTPDTYKLEFDSGWVGWHQRSNLRIIKRIRRSSCTSLA